MKSFPWAVLLILAAPVFLEAADPALTIYNQGFAVLRQTVPLELKPGVNDVKFAGVTARVDADSVILRDPTGKVPLQILEQNYRNDPVSQGLLLSLFEGKTIDFIRLEPNKPDMLIQGKVIRSGYTPGSPDLEPVIEVNGQLQFSLPGQPRFPSLGDDTQLQPTLTWKLEAAAPAKLEAELAYVTEGFEWSATYNAVSSENSDLLDLVGWITMKNESGAAFANAKVKLMAGNVSRITPAVPGAPERFYARGILQAAPAMATEKAFDEYHLYTLQRPVTLHDKETKQVEFIRGSGIKYTRLYVYDPVAIGDGHFWSPGMIVQNQPGYGIASSKKVAVFNELENSEKNHAGWPLPKGKIRFYQKDDDGQLEFVGENEIDHTPKDELVRLYVGDSFDLVGERKQTHFQADEANHQADETFEIKLRNRKKTPVEIRAVEHLYRWSGWTVKKSSQPFEKKDAQTIEFRVPLQPDEEKTVTYQVHYTW